jgi:hypothetical protein
MMLRIIRMKKAWYCIAKIRPNVFQFGAILPDVNLASDDVKVN